MSTRVEFKEEKVATKPAKATSKKTATEAAMKAVMEEAMETVTVSDFAASPGPSTFKHILCIHCGHLDNYFGPKPSNTTASVVMACGFAKSGDICGKCGHSLQNGEWVFEASAKHVVCPNSDSEPMPPPPPPNVNCNCGEPLCGECHLCTVVGHAKGCSQGVHGNYQAVHYEDEIYSPHAAYKQWGLPKMILTRAAADFYILEYLASVRRHSAATEALALHTAFLDDAFQRYINMAVGGELRHITRFMPRIGISWPDGVDLFPDPKHLDWTTYANVPRWAAWSGWHEHFQTHGVRAVATAAAVFRWGCWSGGVGGSSWARIAEVLVWRLESRIPPKVFVDLVWSIQHNNGTALNKAPEIFLGYKDVRYILDLQRVGDISGLLKSASSGVRDLYQECEGVAPPDVQAAAAPQESEICDDCSCSDGGCDGDACSICGHCMTHCCSDGADDHDDIDKESEEKEEEESE